MRLLSSMNVPVYMFNNNNNNNNNIIIIKLDLTNLAFVSWANMPTYD